MTTWTYSWLEIIPWFQFVGLKSWVALANGYFQAMSHYIVTLWFLCFQNGPPSVSVFGHVYFGNLGIHPPCNVLMGLRCHATNNSELGLLVIEALRCHCVPGGIDHPNWMNRSYKQLDLFKHHLATPKLNTPGFWFWKTRRIPFHPFFSGAYLPTELQDATNHWWIGEATEDPFFFQGLFADCQLPEDASVYLPSLPFGSKLLDHCRST